MIRVIIQIFQNQSLAVNVILEHSSQTMDQLLVSHAIQGHIQQLQELLHRPNVYLARKDIIATQEILVLLVLLELINQQQDKVAA